LRIEDPQMGRGAAGARQHGRRGPRIARPVVFSSEVVTGSREENASNQELEPGKS
jgi:hypothetical protein